MKWTPDTSYSSGLEFFTDVVVRFPYDEWEKPSPCEGWRAVDVLGHVGAAVQFGTALVTGTKPGWQPIEPPGDAVGMDRLGWWADILGPARESLKDLDIYRFVDTPLGKREIGKGLSFPAVDLYVHAWDLGAVAKMKVEIPRGMIEFAHSLIDQIPASQVRSSRVFAPERLLLLTATPSEAFIAWTGRDPLWTFFDTGG
jgi:uncharacterized protein (TIGR03086 family)